MRRAAYGVHADSLKDYARAVSRHWWWLVISGLVAVVGTIQVVFASLALPWWLWLTLAFVALVIAQYLAFHDVRMERDRAREKLGELTDLKDAVRIEVGPCSPYDRSDYVQHISVRNVGPQGTFSAQVTSDFIGLAIPYGRGFELVWERPQRTEKRLGKDQEGHLRLASFQHTEGGRLHARFFASPEFRHQGHPGSYLPTIAYEVVAEALTFEFCVRNVEKDVTYKRTARLTFAADGKPTLELSELAIPGMGEA